MTDTELPKRFERAANMDASFSTPDAGNEVADDGKERVIIHKDDGGTYTLVPEEGRCSCPDHQYRGSICKHLIRYGLSEDSETIVAAIRDRQSYFADKIETAKDRKAEVRDHYNEAMRDAETTEDIEQLTAAAKHVTNEYDDDIETYKWVIGQLNKTIDLLKE